MNAPLLTVTRRRWPLAASVALVVLAVALVAFALRAQSRRDITAANFIPNCFVDTWPPQDQGAKDELIDAFNRALVDASKPGTPQDQSGPELRKKLLDTRNNFEAPKKAMWDKLIEVHPNTKIKFPPGLVIIFYDPETGTSPTPTSTDTEQTKALRCSLLHPNHCYIVVYLEPVGSTATNPILKDHMMCCYDPY